MKKSWLEPLKGLMKSISFLIPLFAQNQNALDNENYGPLSG